MTTTKFFSLFLWLLPLLGTPAQATYQSYGTVNTIAATFSPGPREDRQEVDDFSHLNSPLARQPDRAEARAEVGNGGYAEASAVASIGRLKAFAESAYGSSQSQPGLNGYTWATAKASFYDMLTVGGAGLAAGTPVRYELHFRIDGQRSSPTFEIGNYLSAYAQSWVFITDLQSNRRVDLNWNADTQAHGWYVLGLDTEVGHTLGIYGDLAVGASVSAYAISGRFAQADYGHSASFFVQASQAGLNTLGESGHDFTLAAVPEPGSAALLLLGLAWLGMRGGRRGGHHPRRC